MVGGRLVLSSLEEEGEGEGEREREREGEVKWRKKRGERKKI